MQRDRSVGRLLTRAFAVLVLLIVGAGLIETATVVIQHRVVDQLTNHVQPLQLRNAHLRGVLADGQRGVRGYLLTGDGAQLDTYHVARADYATAVASLRRLATGDERAAVETQVARADTWWAHAESQRLAPPRSDVATRFVATGRPLFQQFLAANEAFDARLRARAGSLQERSATLGRFTTVALIVVTLAAAVVAAVTAARTTRRITRPLGHLVGVLDRLRAGDHAARADPDEGPAEIRAVAAAVNTQADDRDRVREAELRTARLRGEVRKLGYRIRAHLAVVDAIREAIDGLAGTLDADHVLIRMRPGLTGVPAVASLRDEHAGGLLAGLAGCDIDWLDGAEIWYTGDPSPAGEGRPSDQELRACCPTGREHALTVAVHAGGDLLGALTLIRDDGPAWTPVEARLAESVAADLGRGIHYARLYEQEQSLVARLQELDTVKTDFMSTVSHELRTPLTSISGYLELLLDAEAGELTDPQRRMLEVIGRNTRRLRELIEDLLILSRIESGSFRTAKQDVEVGGLVDGALAAIAPAAAKASVGLHTEVERPLVLHADPEQLDRVLTNLLTNAVKFTPPEGTVMVTAHREGDEVVLSVADTGMGIPEAEQPGLFGRFFRASNAIHQAIPGTGLGLAIVATIVENHGGSIAVRSTENVGTTFTVRLPAP
jgi:two-component system phosphate regulon sensor histidine kinase PhoR